MAGEERFKLDRVIADLLVEFAAELFAPISYKAALLFIEVLAHFSRSDAGKFRVESSPAITFSRDYEIVNPAGSNRAHLLLQAGEIGGKTAIAARSQQIR